MNQDESIALWRQGNEAWNGWAADMLRQKAELERAGFWKNNDGNGENEETCKWIEAASIDLSGLRFMTPGLADAAEKQAGQQEEGSSPPDADVKTLIVEGDGFVFPWHARFEAAQFHEDADFRNAQFHGVAGFGRAQFHGDADFWSAQFHGDASFRGAQFHGDANFWSAQFDGDAGFGRAQFHGDAGFGRAQFHGDANFWSAQFHGSAEFPDAQLHGDASFGRAQFKGSARFWRAQFYEDARFGGAQFHWEASFGDAQFHRHADFSSANFESSTSFHRTQFGSKAKPQPANFTAIKADRAFDLTTAHFSKVPAFSQADFKQAPDLDNVSFPPRPFWRGCDKVLVPQYRALKRLAAQGYDYEREQTAFKGELRSRRWVIDQWYGPSVWLGMFYDFFADCGRSIWRPFITWAALVLGFAAFYLSRAADGLAARCGGPATPALEAVYLSIKNGLVLFGGTRDARINQAYLCLYGSQSGVSDQANIPLCVTYVETLLQTPISGVLLFLFLLAVRNQFKMK